jgi:hypothetical protein
MPLNRIAVRAGSTNEENVRQIRDAVVDFACASGITEARSADTRGSSSRHASGRHSVVRAAPNSRLPFVLCARLMLG